MHLRALRACGYCAEHVSMLRLRTLSEHPGALTRTWCDMPAAMSCMMYARKCLVHQALTSTQLTHTTYKTKQHTCHTLRGSWCAFCGPWRYLLRYLTHAQAPRPPPAPPRRAHLEAHRVAHEQQVDGLGQPSLAHILGVPVLGVRLGRDDHLKLIHGLQRTHTEDERM